MAPKRAAAGGKAASQGAAKRSKADPIAGQCGAIAAAVRAAPGFPEEMLEMVAGCVKPSLAAVKEDRHEFADKCLGMVDEALQALQTSASEKVAALEAVSAGSAAEEAARSAASEAAAAAMAEKAKALADAKASLAESCKEVAAAKAALAEAEEESKSGALVYTQAVENKAKLEQAFRGDYDTLKQTTVPKLVKALLKFAHDFHFEDVLVEAAEATLSKPPDARGTFDGLVITELDKAFADKIAALEETVRNEEPAKAERAAALEAAGARLSTAGEDEQARKAAVTEAAVAAKEAENAKKAAERAVKDFGPEMKRTAAELTAAQKKFAEVESIVCSFKELRERSAPPPEEEEEAAPEEAAPPAEAAPAPAEAAPPAEAAAEGQAS
mmetsp:Transcript_100980/g.253136  ORF Transcript_100980/g.253136 Transcript_100980/m.253136 type:complete len:385 (+) Transcript_100980:62-1216(+)